MEKCMTYPKSEGYISAKDMAGRAAYYKVLQAAKNGKLTRIKRGVYATRALKNLSNSFMSKNNAHM